MSRMDDSDTLDPKGLIREAYRIEGITWGECRSIFLDWALTLPDGQDARAAIEALLARHSGEAEHPMSDVLREGQAAAQRPKRRGGWRSKERPGQA